MKIFNIYLLPAIILQITIIAGGYGTGQEFAQFFLPYGPRAGLYGLLVTGLCWSLVCMLSFRYAVKWKTYDYHSFFKMLLGSRWYLFEISYICLLFIVLSVVASSVGHLGEIMFNTSYNTNILIMLGFIGLTLYYGTHFIEKSFSITTIAIIIAYSMFFIFGMKNFTSNIQHNLSVPPENSTWVISAVKYSGYNLGLIPAVFFCLRHIENSKQALVAGFISGQWAIAPGILFYLVMVGKYPDIMNANIPSVYLLEYLHKPWLRTIFSVTLFVVLAQTGITLVHSVVERIQFSIGTGATSKSKIVSLSMSIIIMLTCMIVAQIGLQTLVKYGYGIVTWAIISVYILPLLLRSINYSRQ